MKTKEAKDFLAERLPNKRLLIALRFPISKGG
jgi:hypothetical protein